MDVAPDDDVAGMHRVHIGVVFGYGARESEDLAVKKVADDEVEGQCQDLAEREEFVQEGIEAVVELPDEGYGQDLFSGIFEFVEVHGFFFRL